MDIDLVVRITPFHADKLAAALGHGWYADAEQIRQAIQHQRSFNLLHMESGWKIDLFPAHTEFHECEMRRATLEPVSIDGEVAMCPVSSPEDILLSKLRWYMDGGEVSDRQWSDIGGILANNPAMDFDYIRLWAGRLGVAGLLAKAIAESAGISGHPCEPGV
jgi:hypothetical protein